VFVAEDILEERYQLKQQLGRTAVGHQTWLAVDLKSEERVILKLLAFNPQMRWEELKLFEREAQVLESLNYERIPRYRAYFDLDTNVGNGLPWFALVQDYIPGASLQELIEKGKRFTEQEVIAIARQVLEILIYLHELSPPVLHRDIKPSNLILAEDKKVYLVDFGAVQAQAAVTGVTFTIVGTSGYAPLEQFWGRAVPASDLYALGATLIHLHTGVAPTDLPLVDSRIQFRDRASFNFYLIKWLEQMTEIALEKRFDRAREALEVLLSKKSYARTAFLTDRQRILKPIKTYLDIRKTQPHSLKIYIPPGGLERFNEVFNLGCMGLISCVIGVYALAIVFLVFPIAGFGFLFFLLVKSLVLCGESIYVDFNREQLQIHYQFGIPFSRKTINNKNILRVFIHRVGSIYQVNIRTQERVYSLGGALTEEESAWLTQEIQDWLSE
jgi:serine/threonine protein kinase